MGYILLNAIMMTCKGWHRLVLSYDIACRFSSNFAKRMKDFPLAFQIVVTDTEIIFLVPKFHLPAHGGSCHVKYAFNYHTGVGRTYGEGIEANWSETNFFALMTREMPWAARHEAIDDFLGGMNWGKTLSFGTSFAFGIVARRLILYMPYRHTVPEVSPDRLRCTHTAPEEVR